MHANIPIPEQQMVDGPRESSQAVGATPSSERKNPSKSHKKRSSKSSTKSTETETSRIRVKPANPSLASGVAAIELEPDAAPSSSRKGKGSSQNNEVCFL